MQGSMRNYKLSSWTLVVTNILILPTPQWPVFKCLLLTTFPLSFGFQATAFNLLVSPEEVQAKEQEWYCVENCCVRRFLSLSAQRQAFQQSFHILTPGRQFLHLLRVQGNQLTHCRNTGNAPKPSAAEAYFPIKPFTQFRWNPPFFSLGATPSTAYRTNFKP